MWDVASGRLALAVESLGWADYVVFSPDGGRLLTIGSHGARQWDSHTGRMIGDDILGGVDRPSEGATRPAAYSRDGRVLILGFSDQFAVFNANGKKLAESAMLHERKMIRTLDASCRWQKNCRCDVGFGGLSGSSEWDGDGAQLTGWRNNGYQVAAISPDGKSVVCDGFENNAGVWSIDHERRVQTLPTGDKSWCLFGAACFSPDGSRVAVTYGWYAKDGCTFLWKVRND